LRIKSRYKESEGVKLLSETSQYHVDIIQTAATKDAQKVLKSESKPHTVAPIRLEPTDRKFRLRIDDHSNSKFSKHFIERPVGPNLCIGTTNPSQALTVAGTIETTSGGFKFPDGTTQATAAAATPTNCPTGWVKVPKDDKFSIELNELRSWCLSA
jgi:hypothetical protein